MIATQAKERIEEWIIRINACARDANKIRALFPNRTISELIDDHQAAIKARLTFTNPALSLVSRAIEAFASEELVTRGISSFPVHMDSATPKMWAANLAQHNCRSVTWERSPLPVGWRRVGPLHIHPNSNRILNLVYYDAA